MQAEGIEVHDATNAPERQPLLVPVPADILAAVREQATTTAYRRAERWLQRGKGNDGCHGSGT